MRRSLIAKYCTGTHGVPLHHPAWAPCTDEDVKVQKARAQTQAWLTPKFNELFSLSQPHGLLF